MAERAEQLGQRLPISISIGVDPAIEIASCFEPKYNANQKYTTDAVSAAIFKEICTRAGVPTQEFANRSDIPGGSTLGNIANCHVSMNTVDIGLAQLAMHSPYETAGIRDTEYMVKAVKEFFETAIVTNSNGTYTLE